MFIMVNKISFLLLTYCLYTQHYKNVEEMTKNDFTYDEICVAYICAYTISFIEMFTKEPKLIFRMSTFFEHHHYKSVGRRL